MSNVAFSEQRAPGLCSELPVVSELSDDELTALALAADADPEIDPEAVPWSLYLTSVPALLPSWYMPQALAKQIRGWRVGVIIAIVAAFFIIEAFGLCSTYG